MSQKRGVSSLAYVLTAAGILGIIFSPVREQSDYDTVAFGIATISILIAIAGLAFAFKVPVGTDQPKEDAP